VVRPRAGRDDRAPYVLVRDRLEARLTRAVYYELVDCAVEHQSQGRAQLGVHSAGQFFPLEPDPS